MVFVMKKHVINTYIEYEKFRWDLISVAGHHRNFFSPKFFATKNFSDRNYWGTFSFYFTFILFLRLVGKSSHFLVNFNVKVIYNSGSLMSMLVFTELKEKARCFCRVLPSPCTLRAASDKLASGRPTRLQVAGLYCCLSQQKS